MKTSTKTALITAVCAIPAFLLGNVLWPASPDLVPSGAQMPFFIILAVLEAVAFGYGVAFLVLLWKQSAGERLAFLAAAWLLVSWWPHDNMHKNNGPDLVGLLVIEYLFHVTLIACGFILARYFWKRLAAPSVSV